MVSERKICKYRRECLKYRNRDCCKLKKFWECGDYADFESKSLGTHDILIQQIIGKLNEVDKIKKKSEKNFEKCPYNCIVIFEKPCNNRR